MLACCGAAALLGLEAHPVAVEVDLAPGLPGFQLVGLSDASGRDSRERVRSALRNSGFRLPQSRVVVSLAPADLPKQGAGFDLAIALALLVASGQLDPAQLQAHWAFGELSLDGSLRPAQGVLAVVLAAQQAAASGLILPQANASEAPVLEALPLYPATSLGAVVAALQGKHRGAIGPSRPLPSQPQWRLICSRCWANARDAALWKWRRPAVITCCWWDHPGAAKRCWPRPCWACCLPWITSRP